MLAQAKQTKRRRSFQSSLTCHTKSVKISSRYNGCCGSLGQTAGFAVADVVSGRKLIYIVHTCSQIADVFKSTGIRNSETTEKCGTDTDRIQIHIRKTDEGGRGGDMTYPKWNPCVRQSSAKVVKILKLLFDKSLVLTAGSIEMGIDSRDLYVRHGMYGVDDVANLRGFAA